MNLESLLPELCKQKKTWNIEQYVENTKYSINMWKYVKGIIYNGRLLWWTGRGKSLQGGFEENGTLQLIANINATVEEG